MSAFKYDRGDLLERVQAGKNPPVFITFDEASARRLQDMQFDAECIPKDAARIGHISRVIAEAVRGRVVIVLDPALYANPIAVNELFATLAGLARHVRILNPDESGVDLALQDWLVAETDAPDPHQVAGWTINPEFCRDFIPTDLEQTVEEFIRSFPDPEWVVKEFIQRGQTYLWAGAPNHGKTLAGLDMALRIANGAKWMGHKTTTGHVIYLCGDDPRGTAMRLGASLWDNATDEERAPYRDAREVPFHQFGFNARRLHVIGLEMPVDALTAQIAKLAARLDGGVSAIFFDTLATYFPVASENDNAEMHRIARNLRAFTRLEGNPAAVAMVHGPKGAERGNIEPRGASSLIAGVDAVIKSHKDGENMEIFPGKMRQVGFKPIFFTARLVASPTNRDRFGNDILSVVPQRRSDEEVEILEATGGLDKLERAILADVHDHKGTSAAAASRRIGPLVGEVGGLASSTFSDARRRLEGKKLMEKPLRRNDPLKLTSEGRKRAEILDGLMEPEEERDDVPF